MADSTDKTDKSAEQAYAAAAAEVKTAKPAPAPAPAPEKPVAVTKKAEPKKKPATASRNTKKPATPKPDKTIALAKAAKRAARVAKAAAAPAVVKTTEPKLSVSELKEKIMATAKTTTDFTKPIVEAFGDFARLVRLQVTDEMPAQVGEVRQFVGFRHAFLCEVFAEIALPGIVGGAELGRRLLLAHREQTDRRRVPARLSRRPLDALAHRLQRGG